MATESVNVLIAAKDTASNRFKKVSKNANMLGKTLRTAFLAAGAFVGVRAIKNFAKESIQAFGEQERATRLLSDALDNLGKGGEASMEDMKSFAGEIQKMTVIGDEAVLDLMALGVSMGGLSEGGLKAATIAAIGFSKSLGMDTKAAMTLISKAAQGNTDSFTRYGIVLDKNMSDQEKFQHILDKGAEGFKLAQGETETLTGQMQQLSNTWGDFKETIGEALATYLPGIAENFKTLQTVIENWRLVMDIAWDSAALGVVSFWEDIKHFFGNTIPTVLSWFADNWKEVFVNIWNAYKTYISNMWENWKNFFKGLWSWIKGEGFDFKWTGLLEGFESTLKEMPNIVDRNFSATEKALMKNIESMKSQFGEKLAEKLFPDTTLVTGPVGDIGTVAAAKRKKKQGSQSGLAAIESRFLTMSGGQNKTEIHTGQLVKIAGQHVKLTEKLIAVLQNNAGKGIGPSINDIQLVPANFS